MLSTIHKIYDYIPVTANYILQLHKDLYKFTGAAGAGAFKISDNIIREIDKNGKENIRFRPVQAWETADAIDRLCAAYKGTRDGADSLLLICMFVLDFLCIHPFNS